MGDFERTFGAGADADKIVDYYSSLADHEYDDMPEEILASGKDLPRAKSFFDLAGQVWHPGSDALARLAPEQVAEIDQMASSAAAAFCKDGAFDYLDWKEIAGLFLAHVEPALERLVPCLDAYEAFLSAMVRQVCVPIVFARDTGPRAGYVSRTLSTHVLAFPEEVYLARFGGLSFAGPYSDFKSFNGWAALEIDSFRGFAKEEWGREVLEISPELWDDEIPIRNAREWVEAEKGSNGGFAHNSFDTLAGRAERHASRCRAWSDAEEDALCAQVRGVMSSILPLGTRASVTLDPQASGAKLSCRVHFMDVRTNDSLVQNLVNLVMERFDLSAFRGVSPSIMILENASFSVRERAAGRALLLDFVNRIGTDTTAVADALGREDYKHLYDILSPEAFDATLRSDAMERAAATHTALAQHGLEIADLPF